MSKGNMINPPSPSWGWNKDKAINPLTGDLVVETKDKFIRVSQNKLETVDYDTGEIFGETHISFAKKVDTEPFLKIFQKKLKNFFELKPSSLKLIFIIMAELSKEKPHSDQIYLDFDDCQNYCSDNKELSKASFKRAIQELKEKKFIKAVVEKRGNKLFFINPAIFFNGDRLVLMEKIVREANWTDFIEKEQQKTIAKAKEQSDSGDGVVLDKDSSKEDLLKEIESLKADRDNNWKKKKREEAQDLIHKQNEIDHKANSISVGSGFTDEQIGKMSKAEKFANGLITEEEAMQEDLF